MAEYYINNTPLSQFGIMPIKANGNISISGCFNLPKRTGITYFNWPLSNSVEPFVNAEDMTFGEREISISGIIAGNSDAKLQAFKLFTESLPELFILSCKWGDWNVKYKSIDVDTKNKSASKVSIKFTEPVPVLSGTLPPVSEKKEIDDYNWLSFGLWLKEISGYQKIGSPKKLNTTQNISSSLSSFGGNDKTEIIISGIIKSNDISTFKSNVGSLYVLFGGTRQRTVMYRGHRIECFCVDGFTVSDVVMIDKVLAKFSCKLIVTSNEII